MLRTVHHVLETDKSVHISSSIYRANELSIHESEFLELNFIPCVVLLMQKRSVSIMEMIKS